MKKTLGKKVQVKKKTLWNGYKKRVSMKTFYLNRTEDESGVSGTGKVAQGVIFDNGKVALTWLGEHSTVTIFEDIEEVTTIHGHGGKTKVVIEYNWKKAFLKLRKSLKKIISGTKKREKIRAKKLP